MVDFLFIITLSSALGPIYLLINGYKKRFLWDKETRL
jgi:hypothetical protein